MLAERALAIVREYKLYKKCKWKQYNTKYGIMAAALLHKVCVLKVGCRIPGVSEQLNIIG